MSDVVVDSWDVLLDGTPPVKLEPDPIHPLHLLRAIAGLEPVGLDPERGVGRACYAFSALEDLAFDLVENYARKMCVDAGLTTDQYLIETDPIGNLFITIFGTDREKFVLSGSHVDSVLNGGQYDGVAGVNAAVRFLPKAIAERSKMKYSYRVAVWRGEESSPTTGVTCLGSRVATGQIRPEELASIKYTPCGDGNNAPLPFSDYFERRYGQGSWQRVVAQVQTPIIHAGNCVAAEELHIEQSGVCAHEQADVGVVGAIGGAIRQKIVLPFIEGQDWVSSAGMKRFTVTLRGRADHSGGTPPNRLAEFVSADGWYRSDALVASARLLKDLSAIHRDKFRVMSLSVPVETGFTTVPAVQTLEFLAPENFFYLLNLAIGLILDATQTTADDVVMAEPDQPHYAVVSPAQYTLCQIPLIVERLVREMVLEDYTNDGGVGKVRATVTDFALDAHALSCKLDLRDVDPEQMVLLRKKLLSELGDLFREQVRVEIGDVLSVISEKPFTPLSAGVMETKAALAKALGMDRVVRMPSLPGHDMASLAAARVRNTGITFVRHPGVSHNAAEAMADEDYLSAERLSHAWLATFLGIDEDNVSA